MLGYPPITWSCPLIYLKSLHHTMLVCLRSFTRLIQLPSIFHCLMVGRYMIHLMPCSCNLPFVLFLGNMGLLHLPFGLLYTTLTSLKSKISWIPILLVVVIIELRNFLLSGMVMIFSKLFLNHLPIWQTALICFPSFTRVEIYANLEGGSDLRLCFGVFKAILLFIVKSIDIFSDLIYVWEKLCYSVWKKN